MITIIIAHKDYQQYLTKAVDSCLKQTYKDIGICVIDDGSKDVNLTKKIIQDQLFLPGTEIKKIQMKEITVFSQGNNSFILYPDSKGPSFARNRGIEFNWDKSEAFMILDADDLMHPEKVEIMWNILSLNLNFFVC